MNRPPAISNPAPASRARSEPGPGAGWWLAGALALLAAARLSQVLPIPWPRCGLRALTGIPCPLCGSTRALAAWSKLEVTAAFAFNPLVAAACVVGLAWLGFRWWNEHRGGTSAATTRWSAWPRWSLWALAGLVFANWIYLMFQLPP